MKKIVFCFLALVALPSYADEFVELSDFQLWSTTNGEDAIRVIPNGVAVRGQGCLDADSYIVKTTLTAPAISRVYATLLAAKMGSKPIKLFIAGCELNRPAIVNAIIM